MSHIGFRFRKGFVIVVGYSPITSWFWIGLYIFLHGNRENFREPVCTTIFSLLIPLHWASLSHLNPLSFSRLFSLISPQIFSSVRQTLLSSLSLFYAHSLLELTWSSPGPHFSLLSYFNLPNLRKKIKVTTYKLENRFHVWEVLEYACPVLLFEGFQRVLLWVGLLPQFP